MRKLIFAIGFIVSATYMKAADVVVDNISYDVDLETMEATVVAGDYAFKDIVIPESFTYNGKTLTVTKIGKDAFFGEIDNEDSPAYLTSLVIPHSIIAIDWHVFRNNKYLKKLVIPNSVEWIGGNNYFTAKDSVIFEDSESPLVYYESSLPYAHFSTKYVYQGRDFKNPEYSFDTDYWGLCESPNVEVFECGDLVKLPFALDYQVSPTVFYRPRELKTIILGKNIEKVVKGSHIEGLEFVYYKSENPRGFGDNEDNPYFTNSQFMNVILYVPKGCKEKYENTEGWKKFFQIEEIDYSTSISSVQKERGVNDVWSLDGRKVKSNTKDLKGLSSGIYIINGKKVIIRN